MFHLMTLFTSFLAVTVLHAHAQSETATTISFDTTYDNANLPLTQVSCSDGSNGLISKGYTTLGAIPSFPFVGGSYTVSGWNSTQCGTCNAITYGDTTIYVVSVDKSTTGFTVSEEAMNALTNGQAVAIGRADVTYMQVSPTACGMPAAAAAA